MPSILAALVLLAISGLAFSGGARPSPADGPTLLFLGLLGCVALLPRLHRRLAADRDAATFALILAAFVVFQLADKAGPASGGWSIRTPLLPDDQFPVAYSTYLAVLGAVLGAPAWIKSGGPARYVAAAAVLVGLLGAGIFTLLARYYPVGATEALDPTPLVTLYLQIVGYSCLALTCRAATDSEKVRVLILRLLPALVFLLWGKHHFVKAPLEADQ